VENLTVLEIEVGTISRVTIMYEENLAALEIEVSIIGRVTIVHEENLAALEIKVRYKAVEQLVVFIQDKLSELEAFGVAIVERVGGFLLS
jgi:hypothetical protein